MVLNDTKDQLEWIAIYRTFHIKKKKSRMHIFFKCTWSVPQDRLHARPKTNLKPLEKLKIELSYDSAIPLLGIYAKVFKVGT